MVTCQNTFITFNHLSPIAHITHITPYHISRYLCTNPINMKYFLAFFLFSFQFVSAQKLKKADKAILQQLQRHVQFLADDRLEGRRAGSAGERAAAEYIVKTLSEAGITPKGENGEFLQSFLIRDGRVVNPSSHLIINGHDLGLHKEYFPLSYCPNSSVESTSAIALQESGEAWFCDLKQLMTGHQHNPHFNLDDAIREKAAEAAKKGCKALLLYNSTGVPDALKFDPKTSPEPAPLPVLYLTQTGMQACGKDETATLDIKLKVQIEEKQRTGHNVIGYIDNQAATTVIIGAHYDHLGYGEDNNSLYSGHEPQVHNGADDNASGTATLLELARLLRSAKLRGNNYLLIAFSGEELGLYGSKYFTEHPTIDLSTVNYMINMDMVGRLNDSTRGLTIGGFGTSPAWGETISLQDKYFRIKIDSSGAGPSDHTSFYRKNIPVLFFFTGLHTDYHKPSDDAERINYTGQVMVLRYIYKTIEAAESRGRLAFSKTREMNMGAKTSFRVTLGIMPDYSFSGGGVKVDGVSEGKIAEKAGIRAGDVLQQLGTYRFNDVQGYMEALSKFKKGDATTVKVKRGEELLMFEVVF